MTKQYAISEMFLIEVAKTGSVKQAFETVFGEGSYDKLAGELYDLLRGANR